MISIVIPCFQQGEYLEDAIESCFNQTLSPLEIIVVNDGSTDNTQEVAERYQFKQFPLIESPVKVVNQVNKGLSSARNTGIMNALGDYILFLDADDKLMEKAVEKITSAIIRTQAEIIAPSFKTFGKSEGEVILEPHALEDFKNANYLPYFCAIKRSILLEAGGYSPRMRWGYEDYHLWFDLLGRGKNLCILQEPLIWYRIKDNSMIHDAQAHHEELMGQIKKDFKMDYKPSEVSYLK